jgi:hypothetical protein
MCREAMKLSRKRNVQDGTKSFLNKYCFACCCVHAAICCKPPDKYFGRLLLGFYEFLIVPGSMSTLSRLQSFSGLPKLPIRYSSSRSKLPDGPGLDHFISGLYTFSFYFIPF